MISYDRLIGFNQSYRLIKALVDYNSKNSYTEENKKSYNSELQSFLDIITNEIDSRIGVNSIAELNNIDKYGNGVLNNIFEYETKISKLARKHDLFKELTNYILTNNIIDHTKIKELFNDVYNSIKSKKELTIYGDEINNQIKSINSKYSKNKYEELNLIYNEVLKGLELMTSNEPNNLGNYFKTDLYFSLCHHIRVTDTIVKNITKEKYPMLYETLNKLTKFGNNNEISLFKDGI